MSLTPSKARNLMVNLDQPRHRRFLVRYRAVISPRLRCSWLRGIDAVRDAWPLGDRGGYDALAAHDPGEQAAAGWIRALTSTECGLDHVEQTHSPIAQPARLIAD